MADGALVEHGAESFVDRSVRLGRVFSQEGADFAHESNSNLDRVVRRTLKKQNENLECNNFVSDALVDEMGNESRSRVTDDLNGLVRRPRVLRQ